MKLVRIILVGVVVIAALTACGESSMSFSEYGDRLNEIRFRYEPEAEAAWVEYLQLSEPTMANLQTLFDREAEVRSEIEAAFVGLSPPDEIADLHILLVDWVVSLRVAGEALAASSGRAASWDEVSQSAEYREYELTLVGGSAVCAEFQAKLDSTAARGIFAETPWISGDLKDIADSVIGCDSIPDSLDAAFDR